MEQHRPYDLLAQRAKPGDLAKLREDAGVSTMLYVGPDTIKGSLSGMMLDKPRYRNLGIIVAVHHRSKMNYVTRNEVYALGYVILPHCVGWTFVADSVEEIIDVR